MIDLIQKYVSLPTTPSGSGWYTVTCQVCNDYKPRGGFILNNDDVVYHCFNCGFKAGWSKDNAVSEPMHKVLSSFGVPDDEIKKINFNALGKLKKRNNKTDVIDDNPIEEIPLPESFYKIKKDGSDPRSVAALMYLEYERGIVNDDNFFLSLGKTSKFEKQWHGRIIIPFYREGKLIFYQGRSITDNKRRYENSVVSSNSVVLYGYDRLFTNIDEPLFITEGFFDAYHLKGIAINGNSLTSKKINIINKSKRRKIYIPDRYGNGKQAALDAISAGWEISVPDTGECKDINQAIMRFGYMYVYKSLIQNTKKGFEASVVVNLKCK